MGGAGRVYSGTGTDRQLNYFDVAAARGDLEYGTRPRVVWVSGCEVREAEREKVQVAIEGGHDEAIRSAGPSGSEKEGYGSEFSGM